VTGVEFDKMEFDEKYKFICKAFTKEVVSGRYSSWLDDIQRVVNKIGAAEQFTINEEYLRLAVLDYFTDIYRLKPFHNIKHINTQKEYGYSMYWLIRRRPVQANTQTKKNNLPEKFLYINERVVVNIFTFKMLNEMGYASNNDLNTAQREPFGKMMREFYYNLQFRPFTQQTLELAVDAFYNGYKLGNFSTP